MAAPGAAAPARSEAGQRGELPVAAGPLGFAVRSWEVLEAVGRFSEEVVPRPH